MAEVDCGRRTGEVPGRGLRKCFPELPHRRLRRLADCEDVREARDAGRSHPHLPVLPDGNGRGRNPMPALHEPAHLNLRRLLPAALIAAGCATPDNADARSAQNKPKGTKCRVSRIADGDSFVCSQAGRVRLLMIDAPEVAQGPEGRQAKAALARLAPVGTVVTLVSDVRARDDYSRALSYVYLPDGSMLNEE